MSISMYVEIEIVPQPVGQFKESTEDNQIFRQAGGKMKDL